MLCSFRTFVHSVSVACLQTSYLEAKCMTTIKNDIYFIFFFKVYLSKTGIEVLLFVAECFSNLRLQIGCRVNSVLITLLNSAYILIVTYCNL